MANQPRMDTCTLKAGAPQRGAGNFDFYSCDSICADPESGVASRYLTS